MPDRSGADLTWHPADRAVADAIASRHAALDRPVLVGLAGAQGSGKSTMAPRLVALLAERGLRTAILALDDFYLTRDQRRALARKVHPLLATRGVPGTHDTALLGATLDALLDGRDAAPPCFDKAGDDRTGTRQLDGPYDVVLLEGWCVGARPQTEEALARPVNRLEREEDTDCTWRRWVNDRLAADYAALFARLDLHVLLRAPDFTVVEGWRAEQERHLGTHGMSPAQIARFVQHFQRVTCAMLADERADIVIDLDPARIPRRWRST